MAPSVVCLRKGFLLQVKHAPLYDMMESQMEDKIRRCTWFGNRGVDLGSVAAREVEYFLSASPLSELPRSPLCDALLSRLPSVRFPSPFSISLPAISSSLLLPLSFPLCSLRRPPRNYLFIYLLNDSLTPTITRSARINAEERRVKKRKLFRLSSIN